MIPTQQTELAKLKSLDTSEMTVYEIAKKMERSINWTRNKLVANNLPYSSYTRGQKKKAKINRMERMDTENMTIQQIAEELGIADTYARCLMKERGLIYKRTR